MPVISKNSQKEQNEAREAAQSSGQRLGFLINQLFLNKEERQGMVALAEKMSVEQLIELTKTLEQKYLEAQSTSIDQQYQEDVSKAAAELQQNQKAAQKQALESLRTLEKEIKL